MNESKVYTAIGLMSGTSLDGEIDVALIRTDGQGFVEALDFKPFPYDKSVRDKVRACFGKRERDADIEEAEKLVTDLHIQAVKASGFEADIIGFHGQTITHDPDQQFTWQLGDGQRLADETAMDVVYDMRQVDIQAGGQGAPLIPVYHQAIMAEQDQPVCVLNLGGVANVTFIRSDGTLIAFDTGPANAMIDDYLDGFDDGGQLARAGQADQSAVDAFLNDPYFAKIPPKSLDRNHFGFEPSGHRENDVATLTAMTVQSVTKAIEHFSETPKVWFVCGGGRKNKTMMDGLSDALKVPVNAIEDAGWNGDAIEAQGFAYLAVRSQLGYPLTFPKTTGIDKPMSGGVSSQLKIQ
ncbi:MAG: anhydro-N-acetylmuramic acid kinase [Pseudomonadota bacterium]